MFQPLSWCRLLQLEVNGIVAPKAVPILFLCGGQNKVPRHVPVLIPDALHPSGKEVGRPIGFKVTDLCSVTLRSRHSCSSLWKLTPS